ncbi:MAG: alanine--glyoxylate aminotransferase family protein [bacterium]|nr:alanine--glyoxylate aminotransferase family protein [bacterium]
MKNYETLDPPERILMGPGPSDVHQRVLKALSATTIGHLDPEFLKVMDDVKELLRWIFQTENELTIPISATGSAGMETCFANVFERGEKVLIGVNGVFGMRMTQVAKKYGLIPITFDTPWGEIIDPDAITALLETEEGVAGVAVVHAETSTGACQPLEEIGSICKKHNVIFLVDTVTSLGGIPVEVDNWNIDACYSGTQKCLSCPPGLSPVTFSQKALDKMDARRTEVETWYMDLTMIRKYWTEDDRAYHHTAPINMNYAIREALIMLYEEGMDSLFKRHKLNSSALLSGLAELGIEPQVEEQYRLPQLNAVKIPDGVDDKAVRSSLLNKYGIEIGAGLGPLAGKIWRIGLMGNSSNEKNVVYFLSSLEQIMGKTGAVAAAQKAYSG